MSNDKTYNGWTNYETWATALWIDNEQGSYYQRCEMAQECWDDAEPTKYRTREESARYALADRLKDWITDEDTMPRVGGLYSDLLNAALSEVNWDEIATNWMEDVDKDDENGDESGE